MVELRTSNPPVVGSSPATPANLMQNTYFYCMYFFLFITARIHNFYTPWIDKYFLIRKKVCKKSEKVYIIYLLCA